MRRKSYILQAATEHGVQFLEANNYVLSLKRQQARIL